MDAELGPRKRLGQFLHKHGTVERTRRIPFFRLPVPDNPDPEPTSYADYRLQGARMFIDYVESPPELRGTGAAGRLMAALAADAKARGLKITPICGYAGAWLRRSHEFRELLG